jgi:hypothetical protein
LTRHAGLPTVWRAVILLVFIGVVSAKKGTIKLLHPGQTIPMNRQIALYNGCIASAIQAARQNSFHMAALIFERKHFIRSGLNKPFQNRA